MSSSYTPTDRYAYTPQAPTHASQDISDTYQQRAEELSRAGVSSIPPTPDPALVFSTSGYQSPPPLRNPAANGALYCVSLGGLILPLLPIGIIMAIVGLITAPSRGGVGQKESLRALAVGALFLLGWVYIIWLISG